MVEQVEAIYLIIHHIDLALGPKYKVGDASSDMASDKHEKFIGDGPNS